MYRRHGRSAVRPHGVFCSPSIKYGKVTPFQLASEILFIVRPVIYVSGVLKYSLRSWKPFFAALLTDVMSRGLIGKMNDMTPRQRQEVHRRTFLWLFYLLRSPCFENYTMYPLIKSLSLCEKLPLIGVLFGKEPPWLLLAVS
ncbi:hypothetical protein BVRB_029210 [Beta vulgaris subsp. vulgaris]|uniref:Peroxisomal membrane protein PEX16 n=1 Tax=Beta vulgaris subsp. vulgaris TaxID=3555 RepID=A0A0J8B197_BETVV|nr:hypothetical protein BVRB_029210 [Beta vulgaris subsp. vulgaris]